MKKFSKAFFLILAILFFNSCSAKLDERVFGEWNSETLQKTQLLSEQGNFDSVFAYAYVEKKVNFIFNEDGTFEKKVSERVKKIEYIDENPQQKIDYNENGSSYTMTGTFTANGRSINLTTEQTKITIGEEEILFYGEELDDQELLIEGHKESLGYKISKTELKLWDFHLNDYLSYKK